MGLLQSTQSFLSNLVPSTTVTYDVTKSNSSPTTTYGKSPGKATPLPSPTPTLAPTQPQPIPDPFEGYTNGAIPAQYRDYVLQGAKSHGVHPALQAAMTQQESGFNPNAVNGNDRGQVQISSVYHPEVTDKQAFDPQYAQNFLGGSLQDSIQKFHGDINRAIASYNVGPGGASVEGRNPYGGGPRGQQYINSVAKNLSPDLIKRLGIKTGQPIWIDKDGKIISQD